ncbi:MAG TPA: DUF4350 domain-containing protein [Bacillota bacterium]
MKLKGCWLVILTVLNLALLGVLAAHPVRAAGAELSVGLGYSGYLVPGCWMPLRIQVQGAPENAAVEINKLSEDQAHLAAERYPYRGESRLESPLFIDDDFSGVRIRLLAGSEVLAVEELERANIFPGHLVLTLNLPVPLQKAIGTVLLPREPVLVVPVSVTDLPDSEFNYSGVSRLVMVDPGPVLNPAQLQAVRSWLAGGGRLILYAPQDGNESLAQQLTGRMGPLAALKNSGKVIQTGLGTVKILPATAREDPQAYQGGYWRQLLNIGPYGDNAPLTVAGSFMDSADEHRRIEPRPQKIPLFVWSLAVWSVLTLLAVWLASHKPRWFHPLYLIILSIVLSIAAIPTGRIIGSLWQRGATSHLRTVFLPGSGPLIHASIYFPQTEGSGRGEERQGWFSPWGVTVSGKTESGRIEPGLKIAFWNHHEPTPQYIVNSGSDCWLDLTGRSSGMVPAFDSAEEALAWLESKGDITRLALWKENRWFLHRGGGATRETGWMAVEKAPQWVRDETDWLSRLTAVNPGVVWLVGYGSFSGLDLEIQGGQAGSTCWVTPLPGGMQL